MKVEAAVLDSRFGISTGGMFFEKNASWGRMVKFVPVLGMTADLETFAF